MTNVIQMRGAREAPKSERSRMETLLLTPTIIGEWRLPPFQRPLRVNAKVQSIAEELKHNGGVVEGVISLGTVGADKTYWLYDGQHRMEAAKISELAEFIADVRICHFDSMAEMAMDFWKMNTAIVRLGPDDVLRAIEGSLPALQHLRKECPFVGYDNIRRNPTSPTLSMSASLRCWLGSMPETPITAIQWNGGIGGIATDLTMEGAAGMVRFLKVARAAWGNDLEYGRLWGNLNLVLCMWLWRRIVLQTDGASRRHAILSAEQFKKCLMSLSATSDYLDFLVARMVRERDRSPAYMRLKAIFARRLKDDGIKNCSLPSPAWCSK